MSIELYIKSQRPACRIISESEARLSHVIKHFSEAGQPEMALQIVSSPSARHEIVDIDGNLTVIIDERVLLYIDMINSCEFNDSDIGTTFYQSALLIIADVLFVNGDFDVSSRLAEDINDNAAFSFKKSNSSIAGLDFFQFIAIIHHLYGHERAHYSIDSGDTEILDTADFVFNDYIRNSSISESTKIIMKNEYSCNNREECACDIGSLIFIADLYQSKIDDKISFKVDHMYDKIVYISMILPLIDIIKKNISNFEGDNNFIVPPVAILMQRYIVIRRASMTFVKGTFPDQYDEYCHRVDNLTHEMQNFIKEGGFHTLLVKAGIAYRRAKKAPKRDTTEHQCLAILAV